MGTPLTGLKETQIRAPLKIQISSQLMELLAIPLDCQRTTTKWLVMLRCGKKFLLTYNSYAALRNIFRALLTIPHGLLLPVADRRPLVGHLGEL
jgi:hypothetical protein